MDHEELNSSDRKERMADIASKLSDTCSRATLRINLFDKAAMTVMPSMPLAPSAVNCEERELLIHQLSAASRLQVTGRIDEPYRFVVSEILGKGAYGTVYAAHDHDLEREVAVKTPRKTIQNMSQDDIRDFFSEAATTARLEHPCVVPIYDLGLDQDGQVYVCMRKVSGVTLEKCIGDAREQGEVTTHSANELVSIFIRICEALAYAHAKGVVHQDIKPANIMLGDFGEVFLIDWGSSSASDTLSLTPAYMSPQQASGESPSPQDDIHCLGATFYHCLTGRLPTNPADIKGLFRNRTNGIVDPLPDEILRKTPPRLLAIARKAMAADTAARYSTAQEMATDLTRYQEGLAVAAYRESFMEIFARWCQRNRALVTVVMIAAIFGVGGLWQLQKAKMELMQAKVDHIGLEEQIHQLEQKTRKRWIKVLDQDFSRDKMLDPRFEIHGVDPNDLSLAVKDDALCFYGPGQRLQWSERLGRDVKVEITFDQVGPFLEIVLGGGMDDGGIILSIGNHVTDMMFARSMPGRGWEPLAQNKVFEFKESDPHKVTFSREGNLFLASYNDVEVMRFRAAITPSGPESEVFAINHYYQYNQLKVRSLRVWKRRTPEYISLLEVGREKMRDGHLDRALAWFSDNAANGPSQELRREATYLAALCVPPSRPKEREFWLSKLVADKQNPFRMQALLAMADCHIREGKVGPAVNAICQAAKLDPGIRISRKTMSRLTPLLRILPPTKLHEVLKQLAQSVSVLEIEGIGLDSVSVLASSSVKKLAIGGNPIADITPLNQTRLEYLDAGHTGISDIAALQGMPLQHLDLGSTRVSDITPLRGMPLRYLQLSNTNVTDITPLAGRPIWMLFLAGCSINNLEPTKSLPLRLLDCSYIQGLDLAQLPRSNLSILRVRGCGIRDLSPLKGMPIWNLVIADNAIADLSPLAELRIKFLHAPENLLTDIRPLARMKLRDINIGYNHVSDLTPLQASPLKRLIVAHNPISSLDPLNGKGIAKVDISGCPIKDIAPIASKSLKNLYAEDTLITDISCLKDVPKLHTLSLAGVKLTPEMRESMQKLKVRYFTVDLSLENIETVGKMKNALTVNDMKREYFLSPQASACAKALAEFRETGRISDVASLQKYARTIDNVRYLAIPARLVRQEALAFAKACGGILASPSTKSKQKALVKLLEPVAQIYSNIHTGLSLQTDGMVWSDGETVSGPPLEIKMWVQQLKKGKSPVMNYHRGATGQEVAMRIFLNAKQRACFIIEWPQ